jgi:hypothetical protein
MSSHSALIIPRSDSPKVLDSLVSRPFDFLLRLLSRTLARDCWPYLIIDLNNRPQGPILPTTESLDQTVEYERNEFDLLPVRSSVTS